MIFLDMRTVIFSYVLTDIVCLVVIVLLWLQNRKRVSGTSFWVFVFICQTLALSLIILRGSIPDWASIVMANTLLLAGALLAYMGLLRFVGEKSAQVHNYVILAVLSLVHAYYGLVQPDLTARILNSSIGLLIFSSQSAWLMLYRVPPAIRPLTRGVGVVFGLYCLVSIIRIAGFFSGAQDRTDFFQSASVDTLAMIAYQILFMLLTYTLALMFNKRLLMDITTQEEKFSKVFRSSPNAINLTRIVDGLILEANTGFLKISGYGYAEVIGKTVMDLRLWVHDEDRIQVVNELTEKGMMRDREFQFRRKSGERLTGLFSAEIISINNEEYVLSSLNDITARKRAEEALQENNAYLERLNNALVDAVFVVTYPERVIEYLNDAAIHMFGYGKEEVLGENSLMLYPDQDGYLRSGGIFLDTMKQGKNLARFETVLKRKNGETFPGQFTATFFRENDVVTRFIVIVQDLTEQKHDTETIRRLNTELEQRVAERTQELSNTQIALLNLVDDLNQSTNELHCANQSLEAVNQELAAFSYSVSHDLRAPLRSIDGFGSALLEDYGDKLDGEGKNYLARIRRATQNMGHLIDDLLNLSRVTKAEFYRQEFDLSGIVHSIADAERQKNPLNSLTIDIQDGIIVRADQRLMNIAMTNLLDNAWKFTAKNAHPHIEFGMTVQNDEIVIFIRDNGVGFDMAYVDRIFGAFQRLHKVDEFPGTGIGLATVQRIINRHGGGIWAEGEPGKGAPVLFTRGT